MVSSSIVYTCNVCGEKSAQEMPEVRFEFEPLEYNPLIGATEFMHVCIVHNIYVIIAEKMKYGFPRTKDMVCIRFHVNMPRGYARTCQGEWEKGILDMDYPLERG